MIEEEEEEVDPVERIVDEGERVFAHHWDGGAPGCSGCFSVYHLGGRYAVCGGGDPCGDEGPFDSLEEAIQANDLLCVTGASSSIQWDGASSAKIARSLDLSGAEDGQLLYLNGIMWVYREGKGLKRYRQGRAS